MMSKALALVVFLNNPISDQEDELYKCLIFNLLSIIMSICCAEKNGLFIRFIGLRLSILRHFCNFEWLKLQ